MNTLARPTIPFPFKSHCIINFICYSFSDVATASGPTSLPGRLRVMTRLLGGVIGPDKASALATTFPGICTPMEKVICYIKFNRSKIYATNLSYEPALYIPMMKMSRQYPYIYLDVAISYTSFCYR